MKTWEVIRELTENPQKVFKVICEESQEETTVSIKYGEITTQGYQHLFTDDEWEEVKQPVSFMEAVASGKKIRVDHPYLESIDYLNIRDLLNEITSNQTITGIELILLNGKFYIED